ncbi:class I SAM-dependent methyltransferase [Desulfohalobiaceae bacterium Ax17]|uniref:class I SAM-dependent methyltransferase n=1 Tax=Desulfovulcanus ferrireducens TaxID=2831190 RepID=UPI00207BC132|nr:class I SAM-dependent methyltransferase [Desulfovulcanus ferrireducens]MBT8764476.1 class I SAM-dependent methyltransferase [Desulfovulcanus ferrireducens]
MKKKTLNEYNEDYYRHQEAQWVSKFHMIKYIQFLIKQKNIKWLDIGCSKGYLVQELLDNKIQSYGIDISSLAFKDMNFNLRSRVTAGSISYIPYKNEAFDVISVFDIVEHIHPKETDVAFKELNRILKKGGYLILTTPNSAHIGNWIYDLTHINVRPLAYWEKVFKQNGFGLKKEYVPSFLKYLIAHKHKVCVPISNKICFILEEPLRYIFGKFFSRRGRLYFFAKKVR